MADYWAHWLTIGEQLGANAPRVYQVNWFRTAPDGSYLWPGFSDNARVIAWIVRRLEGAVDGVSTPAGRIPDAHDLDRAGALVSPDLFKKLFSINRKSWHDECDLTEEYFRSFGNRVPAALWAELASLRYALDRDQRHSPAPAQSVPASTH